MLNEYIKKRIGNISCPRLSGKVAAKPSKGASVSRNEKTVFYKTVVNTCLSFLNEVKNLAKDTGIKYAFCDYPMPDSSLTRITLLFCSIHLHTSTAQE